MLYYSNTETPVHDVEPDVAAKLSPMEIIGPL